MVVLTYLPEHRACSRASVREWELTTVGGTWASYIYKCVGVATLITFSKNFVTEYHRRKVSWILTIRLLLLNLPRRDAPVNQCDRIVIKLRPNDFLSWTTTCFPYHHHAPCSRCSFAPRSPRSSPNLCRWLALYPCTNTLVRFLLWYLAYAWKRQRLSSLHELSWWPRPLFFFFFFFAICGSRVLRGLVC